MYCKAQVRSWLVSIGLLLVLASPTLAATLVATKTAEQPPATTLPELQSRVQALMTEAKIPGAGIVLIRDGQPVWIGGIGKADIATGRTVDADTRFRIGSMTKSFVAIALLREVERGHLSLEDKLSDIAPEIPIDNPWSATDPVRVKHILEHTAGFDDMHFGHIRPDPDARTTLDQMRVFAPEFHVRWRPGERWSYSNPDYGLASYLLEKTTHRPLREVINQDVLTPLGMTETVWDRAAAGRELAVGYDSDTGKPVDWVELSMPGAGALISTPRDMARYVQFYLSRGASAPGVLSAASMQRMETVATTLAARSGLADGYGIANIAFERDGWVFRGHSGGIPGYGSDFGYLRNDGLGFVVLFNTLPDKSTRNIEVQLVDFITRGLEKPKPAAAIAPDPQWVGWYGKSNPRNQIVNGLLDVGYLHIVDGRYRMTDPLGLGHHDFDLLPGNLTREDGKTHSDGVFARDADGRRVWIDGYDYMLDEGISGTLVPLYAVTLALLILFVGLLFSPVWGYRLLRGRLRDAPQRGLRYWPVAATVCLCAAVAAAMNLSIQMLMAVKPNAITLMIAITTWLFAACGVIGLVQTLRHWSARINGFVRWYTLLASVSCVGLAIWMWHADLLGIRLWAW